VSSSPAIKVVDHLRKTILRQEVDCLSDGQLLDRFLEKQDDAAFAALVRRHGPMVWGVCKRVVGHAADAEDAFQAAFLILVRKAGTVNPREAVGNWLYGVACHTALQTKSACTRVHAKEKQVTSMPELAKGPCEDREKMQMLLDQELSALPDKYRLPVVLCDLEGRTRKEVAAQLKIPEGTLSSRLATAHQMLAKRLARHELAVSGGSLAALFAQNAANAASASVRASVVSSTIKTAVLVAATKGTLAGVVSTKVAALTEGVIKAMFISKLKSATAVLLIVVALIGMGAGVGTLTLETAAEAQAKSEKHADAQKTPPGKEADEAKTDYDRLQGTWEFASYTHGGKTTTKKDLGDKDGQPATLKFVGDKTLSEVSNIGGKVVEYKGTYRIDPSQKPKEIDLIVERGEKHFGTSSGIYEVEGDILRLCWPADPKDLERPIKLESKEGERCHLMIYKRVTAKDAKKHADAIERERKRFEGTWQFASYEIDGKKLTKADIEELVVRPKLLKAAQEEGRKLTIGNIGGVFLVYDAEGKWKLQTDDGTIVEEGSTTLDPAKKPKAIDSTGKETKTKRGIYEFVNDDTCRICLATGKDRVVDFATKPRSGLTLWVLQRVKKEKNGKGGEKQERDDLAAHIKKLGRLPAELTNAKKKDAEIVNALYRASLNRAPDDSERAAMTKLLDGAKDRTQKSRDILFVLVHSHEFLMLHNLDGNIPEALRLINELSADWDKKADAKKP
jgi:RNA polymerase sigma factor (sigma-70 family)